jgi:hypothetical protein
MRYLTDSSMPFRSDVIDSSVQYGAIMATFYGGMATEWAGEFADRLNGPTPDLREES